MIEREFLQSDVQKIVYVQKTASMRSQTIKHYDDSAFLFYSVYMCEWHMYVYIYTHSTGTK